MEFCYIVISFSLKNFLNVSLNFSSEFDELKDLLIGKTPKLKYFTKATNNYKLTSKLLILPVP